MSSIDEKHKHSYTRMEVLESKMIVWYHTQREIDKKNDHYNDYYHTTGQYVDTYVGKVWLTTKELDDHK
jgi:hypothetical protein